MSAKLSQRDTSRQSGDRKGVVALVVTLVFWASAFAGIRAGLAGYSPGALVLARFLVASISLGLYAALTHMRLPERRDIPILFFLGLIGITSYQICLSYGELSVTAGTASFLVACVPCFTALLSFFFLKERLRWLGWLGIVISFLGVTLLSFGSGSGFNLTPGALLVVLASLCESIYFIFQKRFLEKYSALELTTYTIWTGTFFMLVFLPQLVMSLPSAPLAATLAIVYLGVFPAAIAYGTWAFTLSRMSASLATSFLNISPILALLISWVWLREVPTPLEFLGGAVVLCGVLIVNTLGNASTARPRTEEAVEDTQPIAQEIAQSAGTKESLSGL